MKHKKQHYIPQSYLKAWCDPNTPAKQTPYVWRFPKDGGQGQRKSPKKIFHETDMYTVRTNDGQRDLTLEANLHRLEGKFSKLRREKLNKRLPLSSEERLYMCMFVAAMHGRTKAYATHSSGQWSKALELGERMQQAMDRASEEQRAKLSAALSTPGANEEEGFTLEEVRKFVEHPIQEFLADIVTGVSPLLFETPFMILESSTAPGFITSDAPCVWFDPANYVKPRPHGTGGLVSPTIEITLPLSPNQMIFFGNRIAVSGVYMPPLSQRLVNELNKRTRIRAHEYFVSNSPKLRADWFGRNESRPNGDVIERMVQNE